MRILITGYTNRMWGSIRIQNDYITFSFLLEDILKEMGHTVERRRVLIAEDVTYVYDYAFCGVAPLNSITVGRVPETHYVMDSLPGRHAIYADDWSFCGFGKSIKYATDRWDKYLSYKHFRYPSAKLEWVRQSLENMYYMHNPLNNAPVLAPMFAWGNHELLMKENHKARLVTVDPSAWLKFHTVSVPRRKKQQWVMAALSDHSSWIKKQKFTLPIEYVGNRRKGVVLPEADTVQLFADSFGVLSCGYPSAGSGWWRTRYLNAVWAESLLYCDPKDSAAMGEPYRLNVKNCELLASLPATYESAVEAQSDWLSNNLQSKEEVMTTLESLMAR